jgi:hypothetical protein
LVWVRVTGAEDDRFRARLLNQPHHLKTVCQGDEVYFVVADGCEHPIRVTDKYLRERPQWDIIPCRQCGLSELFDAPSDLIRVVFPNTPAGATMNMFTARCPLCGGFLGVKSRESPVQADSETAQKPTPA